MIAIYTQIQVLAKHKSWFDFINKSSHYISNPREKSKDFILLKEYFR
jgi:hypothetical protein